MIYLSFHTIFNSLIHIKEENKKMYKKTKNKMVQALV